MQALLKASFKRNRLVFPEVYQLRTEKVKFIQKLYVIY